MSNAALDAGSGDPTGQLPRHLLQCGSNPNPALDYLIMIDDCAPKTDWSIALRYVPDKLIVEPDAIARYVERLVTQGDAGAEKIALAILEDLNNETVPRWIEVACAHRGTPQHRVLIGDRQPNWENSGLLARLALW